MKIKKYKSVDQYKNSKKIAEIKNLKLSYRLGKHKTKPIIDDVSLKIRKGEILGIIGESGSGKSVLTTTLTGLNSDIQVINQGSILINKQDVTNFTSDNWMKSKLRGRVVSQVFQNPLSSLNPYKKIGKQIIESILLNTKKKVSKEKAYEIAIELLESVMIDNPKEIMKMYPHQMSGGMNQRIVIVIILASEPELIIFDEPTTALDPIAQAQIIEIIREINIKTKVGMILISHDIALVSSIANNIMIMYAGKVVEEGTTNEVINHPLHPYTWGLIQSVPEISIHKNLYTIPGQVPSDISQIKGDAFYERNEYALKIDAIKKPPKIKISDTHFVWSWLYDPRTPEFTPPELILEKWNKFKPVSNIKEKK